MHQKIISSKKYKYQLNFSRKYRTLFDVKKRQTKAQKIITVLNDYYHHDIKNLKMLDVGCSTGIMTAYLAKFFKSAIGIDVDQNAIDHATKNLSNHKVSFFVADSMALPFKNNSFDVVVCSQVYEHVPDSNQLMSEIYRVLKPNAVCYFSAGNRFVFMEEHHHLPLLSAIPKSIAHPYLRLFKKGKFYYENHQSLWGLRKLTSRFKIIDYTKKVIDNPVKYQVADSLIPNSLFHHFAKFIVSYLYWLCPNYIWLLKKPGNVEQ